MVKFRISFPYFFVSALLFSGYQIGFKFIQLGIPDLALRVIGIQERVVNISMGFMAIFSCITAIIASIILDKYSPKPKIRFLMTLFLSGAQASLIALSLLIRTESQFLIWLGLFSALLGVIFPLVLSYVFLFIKSEDRGPIAGIITAFAYLFGNLSPNPWTIEGTLLDGIISSGPVMICIFYLIFHMELTEKFEPAENELEWFIGRYALKNDSEIQDTTKSRLFAPLDGNHSFLLILFLMFGVYFIDSFGFLRVIHQNELMQFTWHGLYEIKILLGVTHFVTAISMGFLYKKYGYWIVFLASFALFFIADLLFSFYPMGILLIITSMVYCSTVSFYTVNSFALFADCSTKKDMYKRAGIGIGVGGWLSSFLSTMLTVELFEMTSGVEGFRLHLLITSIIAAVFLILTIFTLYGKNNSKKST